MQEKLSRRRFLQGVALAGTSVLVAACAPKIVKETVVVEKEVEKLVKETVIEKLVKETVIVEKEVTPAPKKATSLSIAVWPFATRLWMREMAEKYNEDNADIDLTIDVVPYEDMSKKVLAGLATGTLQDVVYAPCKWLKYVAYKGAFLALDDFIETSDPGMDDFFDAAIGGVTLEDKMYAIPFEASTDNGNIIYYNKELLAEYGVEEPTDEWTVDEFAEKAAKATDRDNMVFGTNFMTVKYPDMAALARSWGGEILSDDGKDFIFDSPLCMEAARWQYNLRTKYKCAPNRAEAEGSSFYAGKLAFLAGGPQSIGTVKAGAEGKFEWDAVLGPYGPTPEKLRGYDMFVNTWAIFSGTEHPEEAYDLAVYMASKETMTYACVEQGQPTCRKSIWFSAEELGLHSMWARAANWLAEERHEGPFPMPWNLRFDELEDTWKNVSPALWYGEVGFEQGVQEIQKACQEIVGLSRS